jgi:DNA replication protein DnaC
MPDYRLPPLPSSVTPLDTEDAVRVDKDLEGRFSTPEDCPTCGGTGRFRWYTAAAHNATGAIVPFSVAQEADTFECPCEDQWMAMRFMTAAGLRLHYQRLALADFVAEEPREALERYGAKQHEYFRAGIGMVMYGPNGNGKTMAAAMLAKNAMAHGLRAHFATFSEMIATFASGWKSEEVKDWFHAKIKGAHLLVIDDVGKEMMQGLKKDISNVARHVIDDVLRYRYSSGLPTVMTTNDPLDTMANRYGMSVLSLMSENAVQCRFTGSDFRPQARARFEAEVDDGLTRPIVFR